MTRPIERPSVPLPVLRRELDALAVKLAGKVLRYRSRIEATELLRAQFDCLVQRLLTAEQADQ